MLCRGVRGATTVEGNDRAQLLSATRELLSRLLEANGLKPEDIAFILFTTSPDLNAEFPAVAAREMGLNTVPLLCGHEMNVPGALAHCLRILMLVNTEKKAEEMVHIYLRNAKVLRPDVEGVR